MSVTARALTCTIALILLFEPAQLISQEPADTFSVLHQFGDPATTAKDANLTLQPAGVFAVADDGSLWTTVSQGGNLNYGAIIRMTPDGQYTRLPDFNGRNGAGPQGGLTNGKNGYMYGTTYVGGKWGMGTIFRISEKGGAPEVIYDFRNGNGDGVSPKDCKTPLNCSYYPWQRRDVSASYPISPPVVVGGNLYGVTSYSNHQAYGTLYTIPLSTAARSNDAVDPTKKPFNATEGGDETFHVLCIFQPNLVNDSTGMKDFRCKTNGVTAAFLTVGTDGNLYGTTAGGHGSVFKATTSGEVTSLHEFNGLDGNRPFALMQASDGNLYGTTADGGVGNWGTLYKINPNVGDFLALKYFAQKTDYPYGGQYPVAGVVEGNDGQLYGALRAGGPHGGGLLYHVAKDGSNYGILHEFDDGKNGAWPVTTPVIVEDQTYATTIYGTTDLGGSGLLGTFYRMRVNRVTITRGTSITAYADPNDKDGVVIDVRRDVTASQGVTLDKERDHGIAARMKCSTDPHWVQFIYREVIQPDNAQVFPGDEAHPNGKLLQNSDLTVGCCASVPLDPNNSLTIKYDLTTSKDDIHWSPDGRETSGENGPGNPYYEAGHSAERDWDSLTLFDRPEMDKKNLISNRVARAVVRDYAICNGAVKAQVTWISDQTLDPQSPTQSRWNYNAWIRPASKIPDYFLCLLEKYYPLPAGQSISSGVVCTHLPSASVNNP